MLLLGRLGFFGVLLTSAGLLAGCQKDSGTFPGESFPGLAGTWQLTARQCFCSRTPLPNEIAKFTDTDFSFYKDGQPTTFGSYTLASGKSCSGTPSVPVVHFAYTNTTTPQDVVFTLSGNTLVLDYGGCLDAPVNTYVRLR